MRYQADFLSIETKTNVDFEKGVLSNWRGPSILSAKDQESLWYGKAIVLFREHPMGNVRNKVSIQHIPEPRRTLILG